MDWRDGRLPGYPHGKLFDGVVVKFLTVAVAHLQVGSKDSQVLTFWEFSNVMLSAEDIDITIYAPATQ